MIDSIFNTKTIDQEHFNIKVEMYKQELNTQDFEAKHIDDAFMNMSSEEKIAHLVKLGYTDEEDEMMECGSCDGEGQRWYDGGCPSGQDDVYEQCDGCRGWGVC